MITKERVTEIVAQLNEGDMDSHVRVSLVGYLAAEIECLRKLAPDPNAEPMAWLVKGRKLHTPQLYLPKFKPFANQCAFRYDTEPIPLYTHPHASAGPLCVVFDGPPSHTSGRFVECEVNGKGVNAGEWHDRGNGLWELRIYEHFASPQPPPCPHSDTDGSILAALRASHEAGGNAWDKIDDPEAFVRELRGGSPASPWRSAADDPPKFEGVVQVVQEGSLNETIACYYDTEFHEPDVVLWCPLTQGPEVTAR